MSDRVIGFPSTGDAEEDNRVANEFRRTSARIELGECPNGDGLLVQSTDPKMLGCWECPQCGFSYSGRAVWSTRVVEPCGNPECPVGCPDGHAEILEGLTSPCGTFGGVQ